MNLLLLQKTSISPTLAGQLVDSMGEGYSTTLHTRYHMNVVLSYHMSRRVIVSHEQLDTESWRLLASRTMLAVPWQSTSPTCHSEPQPFLSGETINCHSVMEDSTERAVAPRAVRHGELAIVGTTVPTRYHKNVVLSHHMSSPTGELMTVGTTVPTRYHMNVVLLYHKSSSTLRVGDCWHYGTHTVSHERRFVVSQEQFDTEIRHGELAIVGTTVSTRYHMNVVLLYHKSSSTRRVGDCWHYGTHTVSHERRFVVSQEQFDTESWRLLALRYPHGIT
ncbi:hypothetical protein J6590_050618 [Homalodisca vitripennis]|nr:hypothetical protein J6590_050618 [Homalodisca vitripennis]